ncbi:PIG-L family deacetylase [Nocardiopsis ansamitocini]|uniref:PIG-L family deacetylase n=2 Tax=Nocardiopsis ansamitocini TaxID=1670832 RepID=A0A9W6P363_9ACTN|nr:PIG-L family deacetylase [Nocardiopsis ansamitocini]
MDEAGTSETTWRGWRALREFPALHLAGITSAVVVTPHPGDEVLAVGGTIAMLAAAGVRLRVIVVTDEDLPGPVTTRSARCRLDEEIEALRTLGALDAHVLRLGLLGGAVRSGADSELAGALADACSGFELCVAPWEGDPHSDHEATAHAADIAARKVGASLLSYPVWMWHWASPGDDRVPWASAYRIVLSEQIRRRKTAAISCFATRIGIYGRTPSGAALLPPEQIAHFAREAELVFPDA